MAFTWSWKGCCRHAPGDITVTRTWLTGEAWPTGYGGACSLYYFYREGVGTHRAISQLQGHGWQPNPGAQVMAANAP